LTTEVNVEQPGATLSMAELVKQLAAERKARVAAEKEAEVLREMLWAVGEAIGRRHG
jgi:hypothetical protein